MRRLKIAFVYDMLYPYNVGGVELRNDALARRLAELGHEVHLFGVKMWDGEGTQKNGQVYYHGISRYSGGNRFSGRRKVWEPLLFSIRLFPELVRVNPDVIDCSAFPYLPAFTCKIVSKLKAIPLVISWHQYWGDYWLHYKGIVVGAFGYFIEKIVKHLTQYHIAVSDHVGDGLGLAGTQTIHNGVDVSVIEDANSSGEESDVIYVGRLIEGKNVDLLIRALSLMDDEPSTLIVGDGPERGALEDLAKKRGLKRVKFLGQQERKSVYQYLKSSKVFVFPSITEGFGIAVAEAMACGIPPIVVKHRWNASTGLVEDGVTGLVVGAKEDEFAQAMKTLLENKRKRNALAKKARDSIKGYSLQAGTEKLINYYYSLLNNPQS